MRSRVLNLCILRQSAVKVFSWGPELWRLREVLGVEAQGHRPNARLLIAERRRCTAFAMCIPAGIATATPGGGAHDGGNWTSVEAAGDASKHEYIF